MSKTLRRVQTLVLAGDYLVSDHGFDELAKDAILSTDALAGIVTAVAVEDYPDRMRGPSVLACSTMATAGPFMSCGEFLQAGTDRPCL